MWHFSTRMRGLTVVTLEVHLGLCLHYYVGQHIQEVTIALGSMGSQKRGRTL